VRTAFGWIRRLAAVLANKKGLGAAAVRRRYRGRTAALARHRKSLGAPADASEYFRKVTKSYWPGLFPCDDVDGLPRTNHEWEPFFGSYRDHERRCRGRKVACPGTVVRGSVRLVAAAATRLRAIGAAERIRSDLTTWRALRGPRERRQAARALGRRFRRDPVAYLKSLEDSLINPALPP
jgi:hypothetical protein